MTGVIPPGVGPAYLYDNGYRTDDGDSEGTMIVRRVAAASVELLVFTIGVAIAMPYFLILASPFIGH